LQRSNGTYHFEEKSLTVRHWADKQDR